MSGGVRRLVWPRWASAVLVALAAGLSFTAAVGVSPAAAAERPPGFWAPTGAVEDPTPIVSQAMAVPLLDGRVLRIRADFPGTVTAWVYDPVTEQWALGGTAGPYGQLRSATLIRGPRCGIHCGRVLVHVFNGDTWLLYDPLTGAWLPAARPMFGRTVDGGEATLIEGSDCEGDSPPADCGKVLVLGGYTDGGDTRATKTPELWDPQTNLWSQADSVDTARFNHGQIALDNGDILAVAGATGSSFSVGTTASVERYSLRDRIWKDAGSISRPSGQVALAKLADGRVLTTYNSQGGPGAQLYDPATNLWSGVPLANCSIHTCEALTTLSDGKVLAATLNQKENYLFDPLSRSWSDADPASSSFAPDDTTGALLKGPNCGRNCGKVLRTFERESELYTPGPVVTGVSPVEGLVVGGTQVTVNGRFLTDGSTVKFGGVPAAAVSGATTNPDGTVRLTATSPAHGAGVVDVTVETPGGASEVTPAGRFTYVEAPCTVAFGPLNDAPDAGAGSGPVAAGMLGFGLFDGGLVLSAWATAATKVRNRRRATRRSADPAPPRRRLAGQGGFTLVELLVVVVILGILSAVVVFAVRGADDKGQKAAVQTDERTIRTALEVFCAQNGRYPKDDDGAGPRVAMDELVPKYLGNPSEYHILQTGGPDPFPTEPPEGQSIAPEGNCPGGVGPSKYKLIPIKPPVAPNPPNPCP